MSSQNSSVWNDLKGQLWQDTNPPIACRISFWSVPAIVFRLFPLGLRGRDLLFTAISWVSGPDSKDLLLIDILSKPRPLTSTATISAGNLWWKRTFWYHNRELVSLSLIQNWMKLENISSHVRGNRVTDFWLIHVYTYISYMYINFTLVNCICV